MAQVKVLVVKDGIEHIILAQYVTAYLEAGYAVIPESYENYTPLVGNILEDDVTETVTNKKFTVTNQSQLQTLYNAYENGDLGGGGGGSSGAPTRVLDGEIFNIPPNTQVLFKNPIRIGANSFIRLSSNSILAQV